MAKASQKLTSRVIKYLTAVKAKFILYVIRTLLQINSPQITRRNNSFALWANFLCCQNFDPARLTVHVPAHCGNNMAAYCVQTDAACVRIC